MPTLSEQRPDPDFLLAKVKRQEPEARRGKLRIYFGSSAGVGKTYAMLVAARKLSAEGRDVVIGVVETHGRAETAALLADLEILPPKPMPYRGKDLYEFDLDAALLRRPALILVDELAHSNARGARHPKRWQDVEELLAAGIDVFTTLNVQHLESLNDVVGGITNVRVWETVPDTAFDDADEVVLVDIPADDLLERLKTGKVYVPHQAERAANNFFRKGNLMALRELALRRTADRVEGDVQAYRVDKSIESVWKTANALLTCVGPDAGAERVVRAAARLAGQWNAEWHAVYVETPGLQRLPAARREKILGTLRLAKELGATTAVIADADVATSVIAYARNHNLSKLVIGRDPARRLWPWQRSSGQKLAMLAPDIDLVEIGRADGVRGRDAAVDAACRALRSVEYRGDIHPHRRAGCRSFRTRRRGSGGGAERVFFRFLLRSTAVFLCGERRAVYFDVHHHAGRGLDHRTVDRGLAFSGARGRTSRGARGFAVRDCTRLVRRGADRSSRENQRCLHRTHLSRQRGIAVAERRRSIGGDRAAHRDGAQRRHRHRAMGVRQGPAGGIRHRHFAGQRDSLRAAARADSSARRSGGQGA